MEEENITYRGALINPELKKINWYDGSIKYLPNNDDFIFTLNKKDLYKLDILKEKNEFEFLIEWEK